MRELKRGSGINMEDVEEMRKKKASKQRFFIRMYAETKKEAEWLFFESFEDKDGYRTLYFFAKDPYRHRRFCICEGKTGARVFHNICRLDERTFWKITGEYIKGKNVRKDVLGMTRVSRLPDYEEEEK
jgi:hypothetical protein